MAGFIGVMVGDGDDDFGIHSLALALDLFFPPIFFFSFLVRVENSSQKRIE